MKSKVLLHVYNFDICQELRRPAAYYSAMAKNLDKREYDQLDSLSSSANAEISQLSIIINNLKERVESLERNQTELMDKLNNAMKKME